MTVWWGLAGLLGLLGCCGLLRSHRADGAAIEDDPLARYPVAREPATPNADAAHTPLMTPAITPEMLARPALPREGVPEVGRIAGEIPAPRPQAGAEGTGGQVGAPVGVSAVAREGVRPAAVPVSPGRPEAAVEGEGAVVPVSPGHAPGRPQAVEGEAAAAPQPRGGYAPGRPQSAVEGEAAAVPVSPGHAPGRPQAVEGEAAAAPQPRGEYAPGRPEAAVEGEAAVVPVSPGYAPGRPEAAVEREAAGAPRLPEQARAAGVPQPAPEAPRAVQPVADPAPEPSVAQGHPAEVGAPEQPKHALRAEAPAPEPEPEPESPTAEASSSARTPAGLLGKVKRLLRRH